MSASYCSNANYGLVCLWLVFVGMRMISRSLHKSFFFSVVIQDNVVSQVSNRKTQTLSGQFLSGNCSTVFTLRATAQSMNYI